MVAASLLVDEGGCSPALQREGHCSLPVSQQGHQVGQLDEIVTAGIAPNQAPAMTRPIVSLSSPPLKSFRAVLSPFHQVLPSGPPTAEKGER